MIEISTKYIHKQKAKAANLSNSVENGELVIFKPKC